MAQSDVRGKVNDDESKPIPGAHVFLEGTEYFDVTDIDGDFKIFNVPAGAYKLVISYIGYADQQFDINLEDGQTLVQNYSLSEGNLLNEVVINGRLEGQARALNAQKNNLNITEVIASQQIERFPDANIGDALKRVAGINVQYDQGEARFANIRGTAPELNSITINGERVPSAEAEQRYVQLDLIPADVIETIELNKAVTPDMDGDAIGGSINLVTQTADDDMQIKATLGSGMSFLGTNPTYKGKFAYSNRYADKKIGFIFTASILDKQVRSDNVEAEWDFTDENQKDASAFTNDPQIRQYHLKRLRQSYSSTFDFRLSDNHTIFLSGMYNWRNDWENRYRLRFNDIEEGDNGMITEIRRQTKAGTDDNKFGRLEDQRMMNARIGGEHLINKVKLEWSFSALRASEDRPNERYISMRSEDQPLTLNLIDLRNPMLTLLDPAAQDLSDAYELREITEEFQFTREIDYNSRVDVEFPVLFGKNSSFIKVGARYKNKTKLRNNSFVEYAPLDEDGFVAMALANTEDQTLDNFSVEGYEIGSFVTREFLGNLDFSSGFEGEDVIEEFAGNFDADEEVIGGYAMYTQNFGEEFSFIAGARFEQTNVDYQGVIFDGETIMDTERQSDNYGNFMPGIHLKYSPSRWTNVRVAWTNTISRPNYFDLVPYQEINTEDNQIQLGNPALEATTSMNFDLLGEHFFKNVGIISAGVFYKNLTNVIANRTENDVLFEGTLYDEFSQPVNAGNADLYGFELGLQRRLDFLPGLLSNLSLYANYTFTKSKLKDITLENREDESLPLVGTPENLINASLAYDTKKLDIRLSFNYAGAFIEEYDDEAFFDRWYDAVTYLDVNADYKISDNWKIYLSVNNLLNQPLRYYQGIEDRTMQVEFYGIQARLGVKFKL